MTLSNIQHHIHNIAVVFDTNVLYSKHSDSFSDFTPQKDFIDFLTFLQKSSAQILCDLYVSEMTVRELVKHKKELIKEHKNNIKKELTFFELPIPDIPEINVEEQIHSFFRDNNIKTLKYPSSLESIIQRAEEKRNPFRKSGTASDVGFKDVIIWESILSHDLAASRTGKVIFFTQDADFSEEVLRPEFESKFNSCNIEFIHCPQSQTKEKFQLLKKEIINLIPELIATSNINPADVQMLVEEYYHGRIAEVENHKLEITRSGENEVRVTALVKTGMLGVATTQTEKFIYYFDIANNEVFLKD